jgi:hypothetical membrane protein
MPLRSRLLCGPLAFALFALTLAVLPGFVPGYSHVHQTVSEIGQVGSPVRVPFALMLCIIAAAIMIFAVALRDALIASNRSAIAAYLTGCMALSVAGVGIFAFPHPLHNLFGISELIGYLAPLALAFFWRGDRARTTTVRFSWVMGILVWIAVAANLTTLDRHGALFVLERPVYGLVQRALFFTWFLWCAGAGLLLFRSLSPPQTSVSASP